MIADLMLSILLISSICAVGLATVAMEYLENVEAREAHYMKYGVCIQVWASMALCVLHYVFADDILLMFMPISALIGAGIFMLGALSVTKAMKRAKAIFAVLAIGIQLCVVTFLAITACLLI